MWFYIFFNTPHNRCRPLKQEGNDENCTIIKKKIDNNDDNDNEFVSAYPFCMKLALRPEIIYTKKKYCTMRDREKIS